MIWYNIFFLNSFFKLRQSYIIHQRNFALTFAGGIVLFLNIFISFVSKINKLKNITNKKIMNAKTLKKYLYIY